MSKFLSVADVHREVGTAFASTNDTGGLALQKYWFEKGLLRGHALAVEGMDKHAALMHRIQIIDLIDELDDEARYLTYNARAKYRHPQVIKAEVRKKLNELLGLTESD